MKVVGMSQRGTQTAPINISKPAPMTAFSGEWNQGLLTAWKAAARDRVYGPSKRMRVGGHDVDQQAGKESAGYVGHIFFAEDALQTYENVPMDEKPRYFDEMMRAVADRFVPYESEEQLRS